MLASERASGPRWPFGPQPQIDAVGLAAVGVRAEQPDDLGADAGEVIVVADDGDATAARLAFLVVEEHQVDVAGVVELLAAELAEGEDDAARRLAGVVCGLPKRRLMLRRAVSRATSSDVSATREMSRVISSSGRSRMMSLVPMRSICFWRKRAKGAQHVGVFVGRLDFAAQLVEHLRPARAAAQRDAQHVEIVGIGDQQIAEELAGAEELAQFAQRLQAERLGQVLRRAGRALNRAGPIPTRADVPNLTGRNAVDRVAWVSCRPTPGSLRGAKRGPSVRMSVF